MGCTSRRNRTNAVVCPHNAERILIFILIKCCKKIVVKHYWCQGGPCHHQLNAFSLLLVYRGEEPRWIGILDCMRHRGDDLERERRPVSDRWAIPFRLMIESDDPAAVVLPPCVRCRGPTQHQRHPSSVGQLGRGSVPQKG